MAFQLEGLVQTLTGESSGYVAALNQAEKALATFMGASDKSQRHVKMIQDALENVETASKGSGAAMRAWSADAEEAFRRVVAAAETVKRQFRDLAGANPVKLSSSLAGFMASVAPPAGSLPRDAKGRIAGPRISYPPATGGADAWDALMLQVQFARQSPFAVGGAGGGSLNMATFGAAGRTQLANLTAGQRMIAGMSAAGQQQLLMSGIGPGATLPATPSLAAQAVLGSRVSRRSYYQNLSKEELADYFAASDARKPPPAEPGFLEKGFGGRFGKVGGPIAMIEGIRELIGGAKDAFVQYQSALITEAQQLSSAVAGAFQTVSSGIIEGVGHAFTGFVEGLDEAFMAMVRGEPIQAPLHGLQKIVGSAIAGVGQMIQSVASGTGGLASGSISAMAGREAATTSAIGGGISSGLRGGGLAAGGAIAMSGVGIPAAAVTVLATQVAAAGVDIFTSLTAKTTEAAGQIMSQIAGILGNVVSQIVQAATQAAGAVLGILGSAVGELLSVGMQMQRFQTTFGVLMRDPDRGKQTFQDIIELSTRSTYSMEQLSSVGQTLLGMGVSPEGKELVNTLEALGNVAQGDADRLRRLSFAYGEVLAEGRLTGQRIRQFATVGIGIQDFAQTMGVSSGEFRRKIRSGSTGGGPGSDVVADTINRLNSPGGRMYGLMEAQLNTASGQWSRLESIVLRVVGSMGSAFLNSSGVLDMMKAASSFLLASMPKLEAFAKTAGEYFKELGHAFGAIGIGLFQTIGQKLGGLDLGDASTFAKQLADGFLQVADAIVTALAQLMRFIGELGKMIYEMLPALITGGANAVMKMLDAPFVRDLLGHANATKLQLGIGGLATDALEALGIPAQIKKTGTWDIASWFRVAIPENAKLDSSGGILDKLTNAPAIAKAFLGQMVQNVAGAANWSKSGETGKPERKLIAKEFLGGAKTLFAETEAHEEKNPLHKFLRESAEGRALVAQSRGPIPGLQAGLAGIGMTGLGAGLAQGGPGLLTEALKDAAGKRDMENIMSLKKHLGGVMDLAGHLPQAAQFGSPEAVDIINKAQMQQASELDNIAVILQAAKDLHQQQLTAQQAIQAQIETLRQNFPKLFEI